MNNNLELTKYTEELPFLIARESELTIKEPIDLTEATTLLSYMNNYLDGIIAEEDKVVKPLKEALKAEQDRFKPLKLTYKEHIESLRTKLSVYETQALEARIASEKAISDRIKPGKG